jgi:hypothetical protein
VNLFPEHSLWRLPSGAVVRVRGFGPSGVDCDYPDDAAAGLVTFNPNWLYRVGTRMAPQS